MVKKQGAKRWPWNKGLEVGKRDGFTPAQVKRIRNLLANRGVPGLRDLALFSTAIDTNAARTKQTPTGRVECGAVCQGSG